MRGASSRRRPGPSQQRFVSARQSLLMVRIDAQSSLQRRARPIFSRETFTSLGIPLPATLFAPLGMIGNRLAPECFHRLLSHIIACVVKSEH